MYVPNVDFCLTTVGRQKKLDQFIDHVLSLQWENPIYILEQGQVENLWGDDYGIKRKRVPWDYGISASRNALVDWADQDFLLLLEDDFVFIEETRIQHLLTLMEVDENVGIVGGRVREKSFDVPFEFRLEVDNGYLSQVPDGDHWQEYKGITYKETGCVMNFALFRRKLFDDILWDPDLKVREHLDFYLRLKETKWKVLFTPDVAIEHDKSRDPPEYKELKLRDEYQIQMMQKHGLWKIKYLHGTCREIQNNKLIKYKERPIYADHKISHR